MRVPYSIFEVLKPDFSTPKITIFDPLRALSAPSQSPLSPLPEPPQPLSAPPQPLSDLSKTRFSHFFVQIDPLISQA